ncbi:MAG: DNA repair protein RadA [Elusimicrobia bacterium RIFOXYC2_FULL_34_12]|nr:MAG: DNA repair protein RadA [Elusimicrobia bacterium RIFOXYC2_FULL_34_12]
MKITEKNIFICQECGYESTKWLGKCPDCGKWNSFVEERKFSAPKARTGMTNFSSQIRKIDEILETQPSNNRHKTTINEFDNLLSGGIVEGQLILIGGEPGIGKSTLLLQIAGNLSKKHTCLYISGEESLEQIKMRAQRLNIDKGSLFLASETLLSEITSKINKVKPKFLFIDSIQTMYRDDIASAPGSVSQVRETTSELLSISKSLSVATFICGHVTKEGALAGPRLLEHIVDTVLYFSAEQHHSYRILRCFKNRFGSTNEVGIFEMRENGLMEVKNPSEIFINEKPKNVSGSVITCIIEGNRPILLEVQALVASTPLPVPRRQFSGFEFNRISIIIAVLEKRLGLRLLNQDIFVNLVGGIKTKEPTCDLAIACAITSAVSNFVIPTNTGIIGEVGLTGEVRAVTHISQRLSELEKLGFEKCIIPKNNMKGIDEKIKIKIIPVESVFDAINEIRNSV